MAKWSSQHNGKFPDPYSKIKLDEEKKVKKKKKKKDKDRESILNQIDPNTNKVSFYLWFSEVEKKSREFQTFLELMSNTQQIVTTARNPEICETFLNESMIVVPWKLTTFSWH